MPSHLTFRRWQASQALLTDVDMAADYCDQYLATRPAVRQVCSILGGFLMEYGRRDECLVARRIWGSGVESVFAERLDSGVLIRSVYSMLAETTHSFKECGGEAEGVKTGGSGGGGLGGIILSVGCDGVG